MHPAVRVGDGEVAQVAFELAVALLGGVRAVAARTGAVTVADLEVVAGGPSRGARGAALYAARSATAVPRGSSAPVAHAGADRRSSRAAAH